MIKTISSVMDISEPWDNPHGGQVWYITAFFTDGEVLSAGRKEEDAATELQGLLIEAIGVEQDFTLVPDKPTKSGKTKWKLLGFGTPGGAATYTAPSVQGGGGSSDLPRATGTTSRARSPEQFSLEDERIDRRRSAELATFEGAFDPLAAEVIYKFLRKTSEPASSAYVDGSGTVTPVVQAGAGSETSSPAAELTAVTTGGTASDGAETPAGDTTSAGEQADDPAGRGGQSDGEAGCPPHDLDLDVAPKAMRYPCRRCGFWVKPTMAAEEAEEAAK